MTFSLAGRCERSGKFGVVISSSSPAVAARCAFVRTGVGAACTQNITDPRLGPALLGHLERGLTARTSMARVVRDSGNIEYRQLTVIDSMGDTAAHSGAHVLGVHATAQGIDAVAAGNLLADERVPAEMVHAFESNTAAELGDRLIAALQAGLAVGGEEGPVHSAGLLIAGAVDWAETDLRVDWSDDPVGQLAALWRLWRPQVADYLRRALSPAEAPSYGVPGDR